MKPHIDKRNSFVIAIFFIIIILLSGIPRPAAAMQLINKVEDKALEGSAIDLKPSTMSSDMNGLTSELLTSDPSGLSFTVNVPWEQLILDSVTVDGEQYIKPGLPGWAESLTSGSPELPVHIEQLGVPIGADVALSVITGKQHVIDLGAPVLPVATQVDDRDTSADSFDPLSINQPELITIEDPAVYDGQLMYPGALAEITGDGLLRQQRVVAVSAYPLQYSPDINQLIVYESLQVNVEFSGSFSQSRQAFSADTPVFEDLLSGTLMNYESAKAFRATDQTAIEGLDADVVSQRLAGASIPWAPPDPGYRITVQEDGFYRITYTELSEGALGIPVDSLDPRTFKMYYLGNEIAIEVVDEGDGSFDPGDYILFYGEGITSKYTEDNIYWLTYDPAGIEQGKRVGIRNGAPGSGSTPVYYFDQIHLENDVYYFSWIPFDEDVERWWWGAIQAPSTSTNWTHSFTLADPYTGTLEPGDNPAEITVSMIGYTSYSTINPDHHARVFVNAVAVGDMLFDGRSWVVSSFEVDQGILHAGSNTVEVRWINDTGAASDIMLIDYIELVYPNQFTAELNELNFNYETVGTWQFLLDGFTSDLVKVYDITDQANLVSISNIAVSSSGGDYTVQFEDTLSEAVQYWALTGDAYLTVMDIEPDSPSNLGSAANGADHITITHADFWTQAVDLTNHRSSPSMRAFTVDVQDIYDEFNYGIAGAEPIHDFLAYAYANWQAPAPSYVVLMGDGHYDPKGHQNSNFSNYIFPYLLPVDPWISETASDNRYVTIVGEDNLPDMMIGRLAVNNVTEANAMVNKIINYEAAPVAGDWQQEVLAIADDADAAGNFPGLSDYLLSTYISTPFTTEKVYYGSTGYTDIYVANQAVLNGISAGKLIVNYIGHGQISAWGGQASPAVPLLKSSQITSLTNGYKLPVMLEMTCYSGSFHYPPDTYPNLDMSGLAEVASRATEKGTIANWAATGESVTSGQLYLNSGFFEAFFQDGMAALGNAAMRGKFELWSTGGALDLLDTYTLFGDPALEIVRPDGANSPPVITEGSSVNVTMSEDGSPIPFSLTLHATDPDGNVLTWGVSSQAQHGTATASGTGSSKAIGYTPDANFAGADSFIIRVSDGAYTDEITVNVTVQPVNDPPVAVDDSIDTLINTPVSRTVGELMYNDSDVDTPSSELSITEVGNPVNGTVILESGSVTFTPDTDFTGTAGYDYTLSDGVLTDTAHVTVNVNFINTPPVVLDDAYITTKNQDLIVTAPGVLENDTDPDGSPITAYLVTNPDKGTLSLEDDGSFTYTPKNNNVGDVTFTYYAYDGTDYSDLATVTITIVESIPEVSIPLVTGWNLVSFNIQPSSTAIADVLSSIEGNYILVYAWDAQIQDWLVYDPAASYGNDLLNIDHTMGFWINMLTADTLEFSGTPSTTTDISLNTGWNLVGYPSMDTLTLPGALSDNGVSDFSMVMAYHANETDQWRTFDPSAPSYANNLLEVSPNWGYWIDVPTSSTWTITYDQP